MQHLRSRTCWLFVVEQASSSHQCHLQHVERALSGRCDGATVRWAGRALACSESPFGPLPSGDEHHRPGSTKLVDRRGVGYWNPSRGASGPQRRRFCVGKPEREDSGPGWSAREVFTLANNISIARLASGPLLAHWILQDQWALALSGLVLAGVSDWADGYFAARYQQSSVLGSYLDPLADKVLMTCVIGALGWKGILSPGVVVVIVSRDALLVLGGFYHRAAMLQWRSVSFKEFFRVLPGRGSQAAPRMRPLLISKLNTVLQLTVVAACVSGEILHLPPPWVIDALVASTLATTVASGVQYLRAYRAGTLL